MGCAAIAFELLCIFRLKIIAQLPHSFKIPSPLPRNWNPFCRISVSWPHAADAAPGTRREKDERSATEAVFGFNYDNISNDPALCFQAQKCADPGFHWFPGISTPSLPGVAQSSFLFLRLYFSDFFFFGGDLTIIRLEPIETEFVLGRILESLSPRLFPLRFFMSPQLPRSLHDWTKFSTTEVEMWTQLQY